MYIAHTTDEGAVQSIQAHSEGTARRCRAFAVEPWKDLLAATGLAHDLGKYQPAFQRRIGGDKTVRAPHAFRGAQEVRSRYGDGAPAMLMQYVIAGHHAGLPDAGTKEDRPKNVELRGSSLYSLLNQTGEDISAYRAEFDLPDFDADALAAYLGDGCETKEQASERFAFFTRYCYSCLTDADWLDTERFCTGRERAPLTADFQACLDAVDRALSGFRCETELQRKRASLQAQVFARAGSAGNVFLMDMPTGSGKTLASIKFALERAIAGGKKRIIYVIPYNSIIDQTAQSFERLFGDHAAILRHQSSFDLESAAPEGEESLSFKQASENWDAAIILTTAVQFFESVYGSKRAKLRKLHNLADSILIFDEAHLLPYKFLQPCLQAIAQVVKFLQSEAVLLTATMPDYPRLFEALAERKLEIVDLVRDKTDFAAFKKCDIRWLGSLSDEALLAGCLSVPSVLVVVNSRATAAALYRAAAAGRKFHLSTHMTARDRAATIAAIRQALAELERDYPDMESVPPQRRVFVCSTSLIEAGVDLDFHTVYRELFGLDNILQAAGRCNREGKRPHAEVFVFERDAQKGQAVCLEASIARGLLEEYPDPGAAACIAEYYERLLYVRRADLSEHELGACPRLIRIPFRSYAERFKLIDSDAQSVVVAQDEKSRALLETARRTGAVSTRALQPYTFSVHPRELDLLISQGVIETIGGVLFLNSDAYYSPELGVLFEGSDYFL